MNPYKEAYMSGFNVQPTKRRRIHTLNMNSPINAAPASNETPQWMQEQARAILERQEFNPAFTKIVLSSPSKVKKLMEIVEEVNADSTIPDVSKEIEVILRFSKVAAVAGGKRKRGRRSTRRRASSKGTRRR